MILRLGDWRRTPDFLGERAMGLATMLLVVAFRKARQAEKADYDESMSQINRSAELASPPPVPEEGRRPVKRRHCEASLDQGRGGGTRG
jgi:hypothetical protein